MRPITTNVRHLLFLILAMVVLHVDSAPLSAKAPICDETCNSSSDCTQECYINMIEFENGNSITCLDYGVYDYSSFCCGDYVCNLTAEETCGTCSNDCGSCLSPPPTCGINGCEQGEFCNTCPSDCGSCGPAPSGCDYDGTCESTEDQWCEDCKVAGFCENDNNCPSLNGRTYVCIDDRCVLQELPQVSTTCTDDFDCDWGEHCKLSDAYACPGGAPFCKVCVPEWVH